MAPILNEDQVSWFGASNAGNTRNLDSTVADQARSGENRNGLQGLGHGSFIGERRSYYHRDTEARRIRNRKATASAKATADSADENGCELSHFGKWALGRASLFNKAMSIES